MAHSISGVLIQGSVDLDVAASYDLFPLIDKAGIKFFPLDHYYLAYWSHKLGRPGRWEMPESFPGTFPGCEVLRVLVGAVQARDAPFAIVMTEYFGGIGEQWAAFVEGGKMIPQADINGVLSAFGVSPSGHLDAFEAYGFGDIRRNPQFLLKYGRWCRIYNV
ncbi:MAG: hypothetical protein KF800_16525 [Lysobacter sp.]|nr:hypothetical protein [Lysobacter sp.]